MLVVIVLIEVNRTPEDGTRLSYLWLFLLSNINISSLLSEWNAIDILFANYYQSFPSIKCERSICNSKSSPRLPRPFPFNHSLILKWSICVHSQHSMRTSTLVRKIGLLHIVTEYVESYACCGNMWGLWRVQVFWKGTECLRICIVITTTIATTITMATANEYNKFYPDGIILWKAVIYNVLLRSGLDHKLCSCVLMCVCMCLPLYPFIFLSVPYTVYHFVCFSTRALYALGYTHTHTQ